MGLVEDLASGPVALDTAPFIQVATALLARCPVFLTNDRDLPTIPGIRILTVQEYLTAA